MKKLIILIVAAVFFGAGVALGSCSFVIENDSRDEHIAGLYKVYADNGGSLSYEQWLLSVKGEKGADGKDGTNGESAYQIYCRLNPDYTGTEQEWMQNYVLKQENYNQNYGFEMILISNYGYVINSIYFLNKNVEINELIIPDTYEGIPVIEVSDNFYKNFSNRDNSKILSVSIGKNVKRIGYNAFYYLNNLDSIFIPKNVEYIGYEIINGITVPYCEIETQPETWNNEWCPFKNKIIWNYSQN